MKLIISALLALTVLAGIAARASADDGNPYQDPPQEQGQDWHRNFGF